MPVGRSVRTRQQARKRQGGQPAESTHAPSELLTSYEEAHKRTFFSAPQSVASLIAAVLEPGITVSTLAIATWLVEGRLDRPTLVVCMLILTLTFPGRNRFIDSPLGAAVDIVSSWLSVLCILALGAYATRSFNQFDGGVIVGWALATPVLQWLATYIGRVVLLRHSTSPVARRKAIVVGAGPLGVKVCKALQGSRSHGVDFLGYFDDRTDDRIDPDAKIGLRGGFHQVGAYVAEHGVRDVYITMALSSQPRIVALLEQLQGTTASLFFVPDVFGISIIQGRLQDIGGIPVVGICETPFTGTNQLVKRASDIVLSTLIVILISPLLIAIAIGVKLSSPGPVFFGQRRNGLGGEEIVVYKFRSMRTTEDGANVRQATRNDTRVTRFGSFLRRTSMDELPQFFNVLGGSMSIVGPRPHAVTHNKEYQQIIKAYMVRHKVKPGITGWAQVNGLRGETDTVEKMRSRVEYDLEYLRNWSLALDLRIIAGTVRVLFFDRHAY